MLSGPTLLRLYPRGWRERHGEEMLALLEDRPPSVADRLDLVRGALDARLHPAEASRLPALAAITGGAAWTIVGLVVLGQPVAPDWPGYLFEVLPLAIAGVACLLVAIVGSWLRIGDARDAVDRVALHLAVAGHIAWACALAAAALGIDYGPTTAIASTAAALGTALVGLVLLRAGETVRAGLLIAAATALLLPSNWAFLLFGLGWSAVGFLAVPPRLRSVA
jgi:hypothetical protein